MSILSTAISIAAKAHGEQKDKSGKPYIFHPLHVMMDESLVNDAERAVAVLHDVIEDTKYTAKDLALQGIPQIVIDAVVALTKTKSMKYDDYLADVVKNPLALKVKKADIAHNSSPERIAQLPSASERDYLQKKYERAKKIISTLESELKHKETSSEQEAIKENSI